MAEGTALNPTETAIFNQEFPYVFATILNQREINPFLRFADYVKQVIMTAKSKWGTDFGGRVPQGGAFGWELLRPEHYNATKTDAQVTAQTGRNTWEVRLPVGMTAGQWINYEDTLQNQGVPCKVGRDMAIILMGFADLSEDPVIQAIRPVYSQDPKAVEACYKDFKISNFPVYMLDRPVALYSTETYSLQLQVERYPDNWPNKIPILQPLGILLTSKNLMDLQTPYPQL